LLFCTLLLFFSFLYKLNIYNPFKKMKFTLYLAVFIATMIMMVSAAPSKQVCHALKDPHANAVCKKYCGKSGYLLGECGKEGICICTKKSPKITKKKSHTTTKKH
jgi:hypothetical protein